MYDLHSFILLADAFSSDGCEAASILTPVRREIRHISFKCLLYILFSFRFVLVVNTLSSVQEKEIAFCVASCPETHASHFA